MLGSSSGRVVDNSKLRSLFRFRNTVVISRLMTLKFVRSLTLRNGIRQNHVGRSAVDQHDLILDQVLVLRMTLP